MDISSRITCRISQDNAILLSFGGENTTESTIATADNDHARACVFYFYLQRALTFICSVFFFAWCFRLQFVGLFCIRSVLFFFFLRGPLWATVQA
jgi:hypothetical protein